MVDESGMGEDDEVILQEEWMLVAVERLGNIAKTITNLGEGPTLRGELDEFRQHIENWYEWSSTKDIEKRIHIAKHTGF